MQCSSAHPSLKKKVCFVFFRQVKRAQCLPAAKKKKKRANVSPIVCVMAIGKEPDFEIQFYAHLHCWKQHKQVSLSKLRLRALTKLWWRVWWIAMHFVDVKRHIFQKCKPSSHWSTNVYVKVYCITSGRFEHNFHEPLQLFSLHPCSIPSRTLCFHMYKLQNLQPNQTSQEYSELSIHEKQLLVIKIFFVSSFFISPLDVSDISFFKAVTLYYALGLINMYQTPNDQREFKSSIG